MTYTEQDLETIVLSQDARAICRQHWKEDGKGYPAKSCCRGCPIMGACHTWFPTTIDGIILHRIGLNEAAKKATQ